MGFTKKSKKSTFAKKDIPYVTQIIGPGNYTEVNGNASADNSDMSQGNKQPNSQAFKLSGVQAPKKPGTQDHSKQNQPKQERRYFPSIDGLRALAVLSVLAYHLKLPFAQGGLLGVTIFFVISGFLITSILIGELKTRKTIRLGRFWFRRVRRLFPAIVLVVVTTALLTLIFNPDMLYKLKTDLLPALFWFTNWWYIFKQESYFEAMAAPSPVLHFWSLSIEEQFYLVWPLILLAMFKLRASAKTARRITLGLAVASVLLMAALYDPTGDPSRVYYGTDTRAFSLLVGAYLAYLWPVFLAQGSANPTNFSAHTQIAIRALGAFGLAVLLVMTCFVSGTSAYLYYGGLALASVCTAFLIAAITLPSSILGRVLKTPVFTWIGTRSYGIYLWHYPLLLLLNPANAAAPGALKILAEIALIFAVSELSYRFVENPIRRGAIGKFISDARAGYVSRNTVLQAKALCCACALVVVVSGVGLAGAKNPDSGMGLLSQADIEAGTAEGTLVSAGEQGGAEGGAGGSEGEDGSSAGAGGETSAQDAVAYEPLMIGDSVSVGLVDVFHEAFTGGLLDACGNRQLSTGEAVYDYYLSQNKVGTNVIIALGANGSFELDALEAFVAKMGESKNIWLVTTRSPDVNDATTNANIYSVAANHPNNVHVIDWYSYCAGHEEDWLNKDGVHLTNNGRAAYMQFVVAAIGDNEKIASASTAANKKAGGAWVAPTDGSITSEMNTALYYGATPAAIESSKTTGEVLP